MFVKKSIQYLGRTKIKTIIYVLIQSSLAYVFLSGISIYLCSTEYLEMCDKVFVTVGSLEYIGEYYPNEYASDANMERDIANLDIEKFTNNSFVKCIERTDKYFANVEGFIRNDEGRREKDIVVLGVFECFLLNEDEKIYQCIVSDCFFSDREMQGHTINVYSEDIKLERGKKYVITGRIDWDRSILPFVELEEYKQENITFDAPALAEWDGELIPKEYLLIANTLQVKHDALTIIPTNDIKAVYGFHNKQLYIEEGRIFDEVEYTTGANVCIVNGMIAEAMNLSIGDFIDISILKETDSGFYDSFWAGVGFDYKNKYEVVGITNKYSALVEKIYIPGGNSFFDSRDYLGYEILKLRLDNRNAMQYMLEIQEYIPENFKFTVFDQGYSQVAKIYMDMRTLSIVVILVSIVFSLSFIFLINYTYVYSRKRSIYVLWWYGTTIKQIIIYFIAGGLIFSSIAIGIGCILTYLSKSRVYEVVFNMVEKRNDLDLKFSDYGKAMQFKALDFQVNNSIGNEILYSIFYLSLAMLVMLIFVSAVIVGIKKGSLNVEIEG